MKVSCAIIEYRNEEIARYRARYIVENIGQIPLKRLDKPIVIDGMIIKDNWIIEDIYGTYLINFGTIPKLTTIPIIVKSISKNYRYNIEVSKGNILLI